MNIADRIQTLRKSRGISQEELADKIGVSRQAVSKWESEQSSPDLEKIILLSDYFDVTTDYLLKGIEPVEDEPKTKADARIFSVLATVLNFIGLLAAIIIWEVERTSISVLGGFIIMAVGCMCFVIGQFMGTNMEKSAFMFGLINVWLLSLMPISSIFNFIQGIRWGNWWTFVPVPQLRNSIGAYIMCWAVYFAVCVCVDLIILKRAKK